MSVIDALLVMCGGLWAGLINTVVGSGTLVTFPLLLWMGYPPVTANVSNSMGLVAGGLSGSWGYRHEIIGGPPMLRRLAPFAFAGSVVGALLLLKLPPEAFKAIVPVLIAIALVLVMVGPSIQRRAAARRDEHGSDPAWHTPVLTFGIFCTGIYGGYFGAAQGVVMMGLFSMLSAEPLQRLNGIKNVLGTVINLVGVLTFLLFARQHIDWAIAACIGGGALLGGVIGARVGRKLSPTALRAVIVVIGTIALVRLIWFAD